MLKKMFYPIIAATRNTIFKKIFINFKLCWMRQIDQLKNNQDTKV